MSINSLKITLENLEKTLTEETETLNNHIAQLSNEIKIVEEENQEMQKWFARMMEFIKGTSPKSGVSQYAHGDY